MAQQAYVDLDLAVIGSNGLYKAVGVSSLSGAPVSTELLFDEGVWPLRDRLSSGFDDAELRVAGTPLYEAVFAGDLEVLLLDSLSAANGSRHGWRLRLDLGQAPDLDNLPWESLYSPKLGAFLALSKNRAIVRNVVTALGPSAVAVEPPLRILVVLSNPRDTGKIDTEAERLAIRKAFAEGIAKGTVEVSDATDPSLASLLDTLRQAEFHLLHLAGHGGFDEVGGYVVLEDSRTGGSNKIRAEELGPMLSDHRSLQLVFLNSGQSATSAEGGVPNSFAEGLVQRGVPVVIGMQGEITDEASVDFTGEFYRGLAAGTPVDTALSAARVGVHAHTQDAGWTAPTLYTSIRDVPILEPLDEAPASKAAAPRPVVQKDLEVKAAEQPSSSAPDVVREPPGLGRSPAQGDEASTVDHLGREQLVEALAAMLDDEQQGTPFTMALFGYWGAGKSSLMEQLRRRLEPGKGRKPGSSNEQRLSRNEHDRDTTHEFIFADFNAWRYEHTDNMAAGLVQETVRSLVDLPWYAKLRLRWGFAWREYRFRLLGALALFVGSAVAAIYGIVSGVAEEELAKVLFGAGGAAVLVFVGRFLVEMYRHPVSAELMTYFRLPQFGQYLGLWSVMERQLRTLTDVRFGRNDTERNRRRMPFLGVRAAKPRRLIVLVDDLDRCSPEAVTQTFEAIRLVMDLPHVVIVLALDPRATLQAIAHEYRDQETEVRKKEDIARDYLGKIIQLPIQLPPPEPTHIAGYIRESLFPDAIDSAESRSVGRAGQAPSQPAAASTPSDQVDLGTLGSARPSGRTEFPQLVDTATVAENLGESELPASETEPARSDSERVPSPPRDLQLEMRETKAEVARFVEVAQRAGFENPRQLRRLRNCYRLLKALHPALEWEKTQVMLFWQEFLHSRPGETHVGYEDAVLAELVELPKGAPESDRDAFEFMSREVQDEFAADLADYIAYRSAVKRLVLPRLA